MSKESDCLVQYKIFELRRYSVFESVMFSILRDGQEIGNMLLRPNVQKITHRVLRKKLLPRISIKYLEIQDFLKFVEKWEFKYPENRPVLS